MAAKTTAPVKVDVSFTVGSQAIKFAGVYRLATETVRVRIVRDSYRHQSYAVVEVLNAEKTWTDLASWDPQNWYERTPSVYTRNPAPARSADFEFIATNLLARAGRILGV